MLQTRYLTKLPPWFNQQAPNSADIIINVSGKNNSNYQSGNISRKTHHYVYNQSCSMSLIHFLAGKDTRTHS